MTGGTEGSRVIGNSPLKQPMLAKKLRRCVCGCVLQVCHLQVILL